MIATAAGAGMLTIDVLLVILVVLGASCVMFWLLARHYTRDRARASLSDWAALHGFTVDHSPEPQRPEALAFLGECRIVACLSDHDTWMGQVETPRLPGDHREGRPARWNLLVRKLETAWALCALRPAQQEVSVLDFLPLQNLYATQPGERYTLYGAERATTRALGKSSVRGLLPSDLGLLLTGHYLVVDFSPRPFDPLELHRVDALVEQLVAHLPLPAGGQAGKKP